MKSKKFAAYLLAGILCFAALTACSSNEQPVSTELPAAARSDVSSDPVAPAETSDIGEEISDKTSDTSSSDSTGTPLGEFTTQDINGQTYTQDIFKDYELTLVNVFATWCSPCVAELPDLEKLHNQMADQGVNVIGVLLDVLDSEGEMDPESVERAELLVEKTGVTYLILVPDSTYFNGRLAGIEAIPETFFVDKNGNIVGETYTGSASLEDWTAIVEKELANLKESE